MTYDIDIDDVHVRFGDVRAVDGMTLRLGGGKIHGLLGRNGSGKSTLLATLAAFRKPSAGTVRIDGQPVFENSGITRQVCLIREAGDTLEGDEKVRSALEFAARMRQSWDGDLAERLLERFEIDPEARIETLSRGRRSALGVTLGLATRAPVTMFDESYLGMDAPSRYAFYDELLADFMEHPRTVVISTHLIEEVSSLFEEVVIIDRGRLVLQGEADELRSQGAAVTGPADVVDRFVAGHTVLGEKRLGGTKSVMLYGELDRRRIDEAHAAGLDLGPVALQDLFVHLTETTGGRA